VKAVAIKPSLTIPAAIVIAPKCQTNARNKWLAARQQELLPVDYYHLVFSVPHTLVPLIWQNQRVLFKLLFDASAATLIEVAADPKHLGAEIGFLSVLHTCGQTLQPHPTFIASCQAGDYRRIMPGGFARLIASSCRSRF
jgi:Transposase zinc-binding domain